MYLRKTLALAAVLAASNPFAAPAKAESQAPSGHAATATQPLSALDYEEIRQLLARYCHTLDFGDIDGFVALFAPDGVFESRNTRGDVSIPGGKMNIRRGTEQLRAFGRELNPPGRVGGSRHGTINTLIEGDSRRAYSSSYFFTFRDLGMAAENGPAPRNEFGTSGLYIDEFVKLNGHWVFAKRTVRYNGYPEMNERQGKPVDARRPFAEIPGAR